MKIKKHRLLENSTSLLAQIIMLMVILTILCYVMNQTGLSTTGEAVIDVLVIGSITVLLIVQFAKFRLSNWQRLIILCGYLLRIIVMLIDIYAADAITIMHSGDDSIGFYRVAREIFETGSAERSSAYTIALSRIFVVIGENRLLAQYLNILCFVGTVVVIIECIRMFPIVARHETWILAFLCLLPNYICLSAILLRESFMIFADTAAVFCFVLWMKKDEWKYFVLAFMAALPAIILHSASIGLWIAFFIIAFIWDNKGEKYRVNRKSGIFIALAAIVGMTIIVVPRFRNLLLLYIPSDFSVNSLTMRYFEEGGSDYLRNISIDSWTQFYFWTVIRMVYFLLAPMPMDWRGLGDAAAFVIDSIPIIVMIVGTVKGICKSRNWRYAMTGILSCLVVIGIFAWGVSNAGTAMRHRGLLIGMFAIAYCISKSGNEHEC